MRHALPLIHCVDEETRAKLLGMITDPPPEICWVEWPEIEFKPIYHTAKELEYIQAHTEAIDKFMRQAPSRSRG